MMKKQNMTKNKQTAVDWIVSQLYLTLNIRLNNDYLEKLYEQAKGMEKEQINKAFFDGYYQEELYDARKYYDDTFLKKN